MSTPSDCQGAWLRARLFAWCETIWKRLAGDKERFSEGDGLPWTAELKVKSPCWLMAWLQADEASSCCNVIDYIYRQVLGRAFSCYWPVLASAQLSASIECQNQRLKPSQGPLAFNPINITQDGSQRGTRERRTNSRGRPSPAPSLAYRRKQDIHGPCVGHMEPSQALTPQGSEVGSTAQQRSQVMDQ